MADLLHQSELWKHKECNSGKNQIFKKFKFKKQNNYSIDRIDLLSSSETGSMMQFILGIKND